MFLTDAEYRAHPGVNYSTLKYLRKSALHYRHAVDNQEERAEYAMLRSVHCFVLDPMAAHEQIAVWDGRRDKRDKAYVAFLEANAGKNILNQAEYEQALQIANSYGRNKWLQWVLAQPHTLCEEAIVWDQPVGDGLLLCKGKPDLFHYSAANGLIIADLKTFGDTSAELVAWAARKYGWMLQLAHYSHAAANYWNIDLNEVPVRWYTVVAEDKGPWDATAIEWDQSTMQSAMAEHRGLLIKLAHHLRTDTWPGCGDVQVATLPAGPVTE